MCVSHRYAMEAVSKLELSGIVYPPCPLPSYGAGALPQSAAAGNAAALAPGAATNPAMLAAMQVCTCTAAQAENISSLSLSLNFGHF